VIGSECWYWKVDEHSASSDEEVVGAAEPSMAMCADGGMLMLCSSVYRKRGYMYRQFKKLHGADDSDGVCWFATSATMNPKLLPAVIEKALAEDKSKASAVFLNIWREDLSDFIPAEVIEANTDHNTFERAPVRGHDYVAFVDCAGGLGSDSFTMAIAHAEDDALVLDLIRERKPRFVPRDVIAEFAKILRTYGIGAVMSDGYAGGFHADEWSRNNFLFLPCTWTTSENYLHALPMLLAKRARLIDSSVLRSQLVSLERGVQASGHEVVSHPKIASAHDDVATAVCGALVEAANRARYNLSAMADVPVAKKLPERSPAAQMLSGYLLAHGVF
jgi:hypothetical protein